MDDSYIDFYIFIKENEENLIDVLNVKLKDTDDDFGFINEHYIVECTVGLIDVTLQSPYVIVEKTCLVNRKQFNNWKEKRNAIIWI